MLRDPNGDEEAPLLLDEARFAAAWDGDVILVKRDYRLRDEDRPFGMAWVAGQLLRDRRVVRDLAVAPCCSGLLAVSPVVFWRVMIDRVMYYGSLSTFTMLCIAFARAVGVRDDIRSICAAILLFLSRRGSMPRFGRTCSTRC